MLTFFIALKLVALLSYLALLILTLWSNAERSTRVFFSVFLFGMLFWQFTSLMVNLSRDAAMALFWYNLLIGGSGTFNILFFLFTRAFLKVKKQMVLTVCAYIVCAALLVGGLFGLQFHAVTIGRGGYYVPVFDNDWLYALAAIAYFFWGCGIFNLVRGLTKEKSPVQKNRITYVLLGASVVFIGAATNLTGLRDYPVDICFNLASALIIGIAVVRHKLLDIRFVLARSLLYSVLTAAIIAAYLGIVFSLERILSRSIGYTGPVSGLVAILILALVFLPLRNIIQKALDRFFFREKSDYQRATQAFSRDITTLYNTAEILDLVAGILGRTMKAGGVSIALFDERRNSFAVVKAMGSFSHAGEPLFGEQSAIARWLCREGVPFLREEAVMYPERMSMVEENRSLFEVEDVAVVAPILLKDRLLGTVNLGPKLSGTMFNDEDLRFLTTIANQTATAIEKSNIFGEMQRRLSEQTLLFILSEKFRGTADFDSVMLSIVQILKNFLNCDHCALVFYGKESDAKSYALDPVSLSAAELASQLRARMSEYAAARRDAIPIPREEIAALAGQGSAPPGGTLSPIVSLVYYPLQSGDESLGMLILSNRTKHPVIDARELELLRTIGAILSQGIALHRSIVNLVSVKTYNENILNSLNDMGDSLVILDFRGLIRSVNKVTCGMLGYAEADLLGCHISFIAGKEEPLFTEDGLERLRRAGSISNYETTYRAKDGTSIPMLFSGSVMTGEDGKTQEVVGVARDITEHLKAEEMSKNLLLIKEIHHRIKNNLQVISSLLYLQSMYVTDGKTREMFKESQNRVRSMAILHEKLYQSHSPEGIDFADYARDLIRNLFMSYGVNSEVVDLGIDITDVTLGMDTAVPCGLIINELVTNSLKHAFTEEKAGKLVIEMKPAGPPSTALNETARDKWYALTVTDNGKGFPEGLDFRTTDSLGLKLVCTLTEQLGGTIDLERHAGTRFKILFKSL
jgi:PAS domain S-box-containing protein